MPRDLVTRLPQPIFNEGNILPDPTRFETPHPSDSELYKQLRNLLKKDVVSFDPSRANPEDLFTLESAFGPHGPEKIRDIKAAKKIVFHSAGDTGASNEGKYGNEVRVADRLTNDCRTSDDANRPAFFYHLGDVVYDFGESQYYYDQFYEPFRNYPAPIFAIPGNHDSFITSHDAGKETPLTVFARNFCATEPTITQEAASLHRTAMTQPGIYFTLDAPFVRIIGLFSNALEDPGLISSENGRWPGVPDVQLDYFEAQLSRIKKEKFKGAILVTTHHPPFSYAPPAKGGGTGGNHGGSPKMLQQIDTICQSVGVYPHAFLSGHAHNYQRFTRVLQFNNREIYVPFIVCGDGGHNVGKLVKGKRGQPAQEPHFGDRVDYMDSKAVVPVKSLTLRHYDDTNYGYLRVTVNNTHLKIGFHQVAQSTIPQSRVDMVTVDLASQKFVAN